MVTHKKYRSNKQTYHEIREVSDRLCEENELSVIVPQGVGKSYAEYHADKQGASWKSQLKATIDAVLSESADYDDFLNRMQAQGYEIKKGAHISFRAPDQERFTRAKTLGADYSEDALRRKISEKLTPKQTSKIQSVPLKNIIDIDGNEKIESNIGYKKWASIFNLKQQSEALNLIHDYGGMDAFMKIYKEAISAKLDLSRDLNAADADIKALSASRDNLRTYGRTKDIYKQYRALGEKQRPKFYSEHKTDIDVHRAAKKVLSQVEKPIPTAKVVSAEIKRLQTSKADTQAQYTQNKIKLKELETIRKNIDSVLRQNEPKGRKNHDLFI